jgi:tetratricopeptide (TPR) repeat protein
MEVRRATEPVATPVANPVAGISTVRERVMATLAAQVDPRFAQTFMATRPPPTYEAYRAYAQGMDVFLRGEFPQAIPFFLRANAIDSTFRDPLLWVVQSLFNIGRVAEADSMVVRIGRSRELLSPGLQASLDRLAEDLRGNWEASLRASRALARIAPHSEAQLFVEQSAYFAGRPREAVGAGRELLRYRGWTKEWPPAWRFLSQSYHALGRHDEELEVAFQARRDMPDDPSIRTLEVEALAALGRVTEVDDRLRQASTMSALRSYSPARTMEVAGDELQAHGHADAARGAYRRALDWLRSRPVDQQATPAARVALTRVLCHAGEPARGRAAIEPLAQAFPDTLRFAGLLAVCAARAGDTVTATRLARQLEADRRPYLFGDHLYWAARVAAVIGQRERAVGLLRQAFAGGLRFSVDIHAEPDFASLRGYAPFDELLRPKG